MLTGLSSTTRTVAAAATGLLACAAALSIGTRSFLFLLHGQCKPCDGVKIKFGAEPGDLAAYAYFHAVPFSQLGDNRVQFADIADRSSFLEPFSDRTERTILQYRNFLFLDDFFLE